MAFICFFSDIQSLSDHIYDELWSNTTDHLSNTQQRRHVIETSSSIKLLDCFVENEQLLNIAVANHVYSDYFNVNKTIPFLYIYLEWFGTLFVRYNDQQLFGDFIC